MIKGNYAIHFASKNGKKLPNCKPSDLKPSQITDANINPIIADLSQLFAKNARAIKQKTMVMPTGKPNKGIAKIAKIHAKATK